MSEKWETVGNGKAKPAANGKAKVNGTKNPKKEQKVYTMEEVLPASSVQNMYQAAFNASQASPKKDKKDTNGTANKEKKSSDKKVTAPKKQIPANISQAVKENVRVEDLKNLLETAQTRFPDSPLLWLRDLAAYLNLNLVCQNQEEYSIFGGDPSSFLTANMRKVINVMVQKCSDSMKETFLETCIANTAHELQKGQNVVGWNMLTQLIAETNPSLVTAHIPRYIELRNSYQNRPVIGQAILWSVGQAGAKSLHSGMKVWLEIMLPVMTMKHYSKFVVNYIIELMQIHKITEATKMNKPVVDLQNFITIQDAVFIVSNQINKEYARNLKQHYPALRAICVAGCSNHEMFPELLPRLSTVTMPDQMLDTLELLSQCLVSTQAAIVHWHKLYTSNLAQSAQLIQYLDTNWTKYKSRLDVPEFHDTLEAFQDYNSSVINKEGLDLAISGCDSLESKFRRGNMSWFPWKTMSLLLLVSTAAIINADIQKHGGKFEKSNVGIFLQDIGQYDRLLILSQVVVDQYYVGKGWMDTNVPVYLKKAQPYVQLAQEKSLEAGAKLKTLSQTALVKLEEYIPGAQKQLNKFGDWSVKFGQNALNNCKILAVRAQETALDLMNGKITWCCIKSGAVKQFEFIQKQSLAAIEYLQAQFKQMTKSK